MRTSYLRRSAKPALAAIAAAASLAVGTPAVAQAGPVRLTVSLDSPATITQGEPIILRYQVTDTQDTPRTGIEHPQGAEWLTESLVDAQGRAVPHVAQFDPQQFAGGVQVEIGAFPIPAHGTYQDYKVINREFAVPGPGTYTLTVNADLVSCNTEDTVPSDTDTLTQTFSFPLVITAADSGRLRSAAQSLTTAIVEGPDELDPDLQKWYMQLRSLFSMPDAEASPFWAQIAQGHFAGADKTDATEELYRAHTAAAANLLASMAADATTPNDNVASDDTPEGCRLWLDRMYQTGDDALRQHIHDLYALYGLNTVGVHYKNVTTD